MPDGAYIPPYKLGFVVPMQTGVQPTATGCPNNFAIEAIDEPYAAAVPDTTEFDLVLGEHLTHVTLTVVRSCAGETSLSCLAP